MLGFHWCHISSVGYHTNTGCLAGIGELASLGGWYFSWYFCYCKLWRDVSFNDLAETPFLNNLAGTPLFLKRGAAMHQKGG